MLTSLDAARRFIIAAIAIAGLSAPSLAGNYPTIVSYPTVTPTPVIADDTSVYNVTTIINDKDGYNDIADIRVLFNYVEGDGARGYLVWATSDSLITRFGGTWVTADASGGGRWGYPTDIWAGTAYFTPVSCTMTVIGNASGGQGSRSITWKFKAKPRWAMDPLINDADVWARDVGNQTVGWRENANGDFDVLGGSCSNYCAIPHAPVVGNATAHTLDVSIAAADSSLDLFCIRVSPAIPSMQYVQADGSLGGYPVLQTKAAWGTKTVTGLASDKSYTFKVRAARSGYCPSAWGPTASGRTSVLVHQIDYTNTGLPISKGIAGMNVLPWNMSTQTFADYFATSQNTSIRAAGEAYNWKTRNAIWNCGTRTILESLREARDSNSYLQILVNTRGIGVGNGSTWVYTDQTPETVTALARDLVFYCNNLVQNKRQGDPLTQREQALLDSLSWGTDDKLLAPSEAPVPKVTYWEIGNEPEGMPAPMLPPADYSARYKMMTQAMLQEDPTIKFGPSVINPQDNAWLNAVLADPANQVDFVCYHPYGPLYRTVVGQSGGVLNADDLTNSLNTIRQQQFVAWQYAVDRLVANGRPTSIPMAATECNPSSWEGTYYYELNRTMAHALGIPETIFAFADKGFLASQYWDLPNNGGSATIKLPGFKMYQALQSYMGDRLLESYTEYDFRLYTTLDTSTGRLILWALNLSEYYDKSMRFQVPGDTSGMTIQHRRLGAVSGATSLITKNNAGDASENVQWITTDLTGSVNPADFTMSFPHSTATMLILDRPLMSVPDSTRISLNGRVVTAAYPSENYLYLEQDDRTFGIRVEGAFSEIAAGDRATVAGVIGTKKPDGVTKSERVITGLSIVGATGAGYIKPLAMTCRDVGGGASKFTVGVNNGLGPNNIGLLVRVAGKVTYVADAEYMYVDDGSQIADFPGLTGVLVRCPSTASFRQGDPVVVTGVVEGSVPTGCTTNRRFIRALPVGGVFGVR
jgi:hypothetical protein